MKDYISGCNSCKGGIQDASKPCSTACKKTLEAEIHKRRKVLDDIILSALGIGKGIPDIYHLR